MTLSVQLSLCQSLHNPSNPEETASPAVECSLTLPTLDTTPIGFVPRKLGLTCRPASTKIRKSSQESGPVAQLGARFHGMEEVIGSIPIRSTKHFNSLAFRSSYSGNNRGNGKEP